MIQDILKRVNGGVVFGIMWLVFLLSASCSTSVEVDIVIKNGTVYNGYDTVSKLVTVAVKGDKIIYIGSPEGAATFRARTVIDAKGLIVSPGFIDPHTHAGTDLKNSDRSANLPFLMQGITTVFVGNDGKSPYPMAKYVKTYQKNGVGTNVGFLVGQGTIRHQVLGNSRRKPTASELEKMRNILDREMSSGAFGMSTGLFYAPGSYANTDEVVALAKIVARWGGIYDTHLRDESSYGIGLLASIQEALEIGSRAGIPVHISHIKCLGADVWGKSREIVQMINSQRAKGVRVTANQYPYEASSTSLRAAVTPRWAESGDSLLIRWHNPRLRKKMLHRTVDNIRRRGGPDRLTVVRSVRKDFIGKNLLELSKELRLPPAQAVYKILEEDVEVRIASFNMTPEDINRFMKCDWVVTGSDGTVGHPRKYGSFPRKWRKYVVEDQVIPPHRFINNSTHKTAEIFGIQKRGSLKAGFYADIVIFDPKTFADKATYLNAFEYAQGVQYVVVNGRVAVLKGSYNGVLAGNVLVQTKD